MGLLDTTKQLWYSLFRNNNSFYTPNSYMLGRKGAILLDTDKPADLYYSIPQLKMIIGKKKAMFANVIPVIKDAEGNVIENAKVDEFYKMMYQPNVMQSMNEFLENQLEQLDVYGNQFTYKNKPTKIQIFPSALWNISPSYIDPILSGKVFDQTTVEGIISYYEYDDRQTKKRYETKEIMYMRHNDLDHPIIGSSPLKFLKYPLSNIDGAYKYRNVIITQKGAIGILSSGGNKDSFGVIPMNQKEKERIENAHRNAYGIDENQMRMIISEASLNWTPMSYPTKDLMLFEEVSEDTLVLIDHFGMNIHLFANNTTTFENLKSSMKQVYQDTIQPYADKYFGQLTSFLEIEKIFGKGAYIAPSYEHIKILQEDKKEGAELFKLHVDSITQLVKSQIITSEQGIKILVNITGITI